jgi:hypothetical protein
MNIFNQINVLLLSILPGSSAFAAETNAVLMRVAAKLQPALAVLTPAPTFEYPDNDADGGSLVIGYQTGTFSVPTGSMSLNPGLGTNLVQEIGPRTNGFLLEITLEKLGEANQVATPSTNKEAYWKTFFNCTPVGDSPHQIFWALSYGDQTDPALLEKLKQNLWHQGFSQVGHGPIPRITADSIAPAAPVGLQVK